MQKYSCATYSEMIFSKKMIFEDSDDPTHMHSLVRSFIAYKPGVSQNN